MRAYALCNWCYSWESAVKIAHDTEFNLYRRLQLHVVSHLRNILHCSIEFRGEFHARIVVDAFNDFNELSNVCHTINFNISSNQFYLLNDDHDSLFVHSFIWIASWMIYVCRIHCTGMDSINFLLFLYGVTHLHAICITNWLILSLSLSPSQMKKKQPSNKYVHTFNRVKSCFNLYTQLISFWWIYR